MHTEALADVGEDLADFTGADNADSLAMQVKACQAGQGEIEIDYIRFIEDPDFVYVPIEERPIEIINGDAEGDMNPYHSGNATIRRVTDPDNKENHVWFVETASGKQWTYIRHTTRFKPYTAYKIDYDIKLVGSNKTGGGGPTETSFTLTGATPVFADVDPYTYNLDPQKLREAILKVKAEGKLTPKAIVAVDIFGQSADYDAILAIGEEFSIPVVDDAAQAMGALYKGKRIPSLGKIGCTSFFPAKPLGCYGDGGAVFTDDKELYDIMYSLLVHGRGSDKYDNVRIGLNARLDSIQAAVLIQKLSIFPEEIDLRQKVAAKYAEVLAGSVQIPVVAKDCVSVWAQYCPRSAQFEKIQAALKEADIPTARYYPIPMHLLKAMEYLGYKKGDMPVAEAIAEDIFALPMHPYLDDATIEKIGDVIRKTVQ